MVKSSVIKGNPRTIAKSGIFSTKRFINLPAHDPLTVEQAMLTVVVGAEVVLGETFRSWFPEVVLRSAPQTVLVMGILGREASNAEIFEAVRQNPYAPDVTVDLSHMFRTIRSWKIGDGNALPTCFFFVESMVIPEDARPGAYRNKHGQEVVLRTVEVSCRHEVVYIDADTFATEQPWSQGSCCVLQHG